MKTSYAVASVWDSSPESRFNTLVASLADAHSPTGKVTVFFRADDCAVPGGQFIKLTELFSRHNTPLAMALVPCWLPMHFAELKAAVDLHADIWCWHMHGFRHVNNEPQGRKKMEFGPTQPAELKRKRLMRGRDILQDHLGSAFHTIFTPPWNNCDSETLDILADLEFQAVSRAVGVVPPAPQELPDLPVNVDLHTRRESDPESGWNNLTTELQAAFASGTCGIMLHHQLMNRHAFSFLDLLLPYLANHSGINLVHFGHMLARQAETRP